tara:strand:+ start:233 stop:667 length:435 start_codon:yes stop_codon:yes gene_type:complete
MNILVLNGPNLNLLGSRESNIYGEESLNVIEKKLLKLAEDNSFSVNFFQSNAEHELIDRIHNSKENNISAIIFNPAAFTHTSIALRDALLAVKIPFYEVHISDINSREEFRKKSFFSDIAEKVFTGKGTNGYLFALEEIIKNNQ